MYLKSQILLIIVIGGSSVLGQNFQTEVYLSEFFARIWDNYKGVKFSSQNRVKCLWHVETRFFPTNFARISLKKNKFVPKPWEILRQVSVG